MGQLRTGGAIFLSAGVPDPSAKHYLGPADTVAISAAVSALLQVTLGRRRLVWGGHPAITPIVWAFAESIGVDYADWVLLYQSLYFRDEFPEETEKFQNVVFTHRVDGDLLASLDLMRNRMIEETQFEAAVFVGGMKGILDEHDMFARRAPQAAILPIMSTGGAAAVLGETVGASRVFATNLDYVALMYEQLHINPNEKRYARVADQPAELADRIENPGHPKREN